MILECISENRMELCLLIIVRRFSVVNSFTLLKIYKSHLR